jgi:Luciferase-like monooxygenase
LQDDVDLGVYTFADVAVGAGGVGPAQRLRQVVEEAALADQVGLSVFGVGEHHRADYAASSPATVLAAAAERTDRIRLTSAVSVLSSDDPVRVFQQFATLDLLSDGRAEIMAGRGSFTESFPLFGYDLADYDTLFAEKLDLLLAIRDQERVTWSRAHRAALADQPRCTPGRCRSRCRSGWRSAATRSRSSGRGCSASRSRWRSSAASPSGSHRWRSCIAVRWPRPDESRSR